MTVGPIKLPFSKPFTLMPLPSKSILADFDPSSINLSTLFLASIVLIGAISAF
jgi:hypothetical protein